VTEFCHQGSLYDFLHSSGYIVRDSVVSSRHSRMISAARESHHSTSNNNRDPSIEGILINLFSSAQRHRHSTGEVDIENNSQNIEQLRSPILNRSLPIRSVSHDLTCRGTDNSGTQIRASTGQLDINEKYSDNELSDLKNRIQSWRLHSTSTSQNLSNKASSRLDSTSNSSPPIDLSTQDLAELNMEMDYSALGLFKQKLKSAASLMQSSLMRFGLGPVDAPPSVDAKLNSR
jgi:hypothetical protein